MRASRLLSSLLVLPLAAAAQTADERVKTLEDRLSKLEGAPAKTSLSAFNPAMGIALDAAARHDNDKADFLFRAAEINLEAPVDPFLKGWAIVNANADEVGLEEAALQTTALPYNLQVTGGRLFASFGRLAHFHDHELPVIDRPRSLDAFVGGESQADGVEVSCLLPTPFYLSAVAGAYDKLGGENGRVDKAVARPWDEFTYLGRLQTSADLGDDHSLELGLSTAWTPKRTVVEDVSVTKSLGEALITRRNTWRTLSGADLTYRYHPTSGGLYRGAVWGAEVMVNDERRFGASTKLPADRVRAFGGFSYAQLKLGRRWRPGVMVDLSEDLDRARALTKTFTGFLTCDVTEFQRLRLSYARTLSNVAGRLGSHTIGLQWTGVLGHHVHGFRGR